MDAISTAAAPAAQPFDYGGLPLHDRTAMQLSAERIRDRLSSIQRDILAIGAELLKVRSRVPHGTFHAWIAAELGITPRAAQNYMGAARLVRSAPEPARETVSLLPPATLYRLAAPSTPKAVVAEVLAAVEGGEVPAPSVIVQRIAKAKREALEVAKAQQVSGSTEAERFRENADREAAERQHAENAFKAVVADLVSRHGEVMREVAAALDLPASHRFRDVLRAALNEAGGGA
jgi:hypothetical protein